MSAILIPYHLTTGHHLKSRLSSIQRVNGVENVGRAKILNLNFIKKIKKTKLTVHFKLWHRNVLKKIKIQLMVEINKNSSRLCNFTVKE